MSTETMSDLEAVLKSIADGIPVDPALRKKSLVVSKELQQEIERRQGKVEIAVSLVREAREE